MLLLIIGLHLVLGSIWLMNNSHPGPALLCFVAGMAATHFGWKKFSSRKSQEPKKTDNQN
ncbi:hypothetical protein [Desulfopila inferna]|uniref:hypothetical protein n=1 Tax=Desulfopila inferna TaxID=468528 RepID=UPI0019634677|nr:hypothetical protein [Desulfopila inferna]MBM9603730.1 hypothetical protein [Desulfopila inferna]